MWDATDFGNLWEYFQPDPEVVTYFRRTGPDAYQNQSAGVPLRMIRTGRKGGKEDDLGIVTGPNYSSDWVVWLDWLNAASLPLPKLDDYFVDASGQAWSVTEDNVKLRGQVVELKKCCAMSAPYPAG